VLGFLAAAGFVPPRGRGSSWSARSRCARQGAGAPAAQVRSGRAAHLSSRPSRSALVRNSRSGNP